MGLTADAASLWLFPAILAVLVLAAAWIGVRWYYSEYLASLADVPLFSSLGARQLRSLARAAAREELSPGARIISEGEHAGRARERIGDGHRARGDEGDVGARRILR